MKKTKTGPRNVGATIELSRGFKHRNYTETLHRLERLGIASPEFTKAALERVENLEIT